MACLNVLKAEIRSLESAFPRTHPRLQIVSASVDELTCRFIDPSGRKHTVHANITVRKEVLGLQMIFWGYSGKIVRILICLLLDLILTSFYGIAAISCPSVVHCLLRKRKYLAIYTISRYIYIVTKNNLVPYRNIDTSMHQ